MMRTLYLAMAMTLSACSHSGPAFADLADGPIGEVSRVHCSGSDGSKTITNVGTAIVGSDTVITTAHFVRACGVAAVYVDALGKTMPTPYVNDFEDLALLGPLGSMDGISCEVDPINGQLLYAKGHPRGTAEAAVVKGHFLADASTDKRGWVDGFATKGMSGSAVYDADGRVLGMLTGTNKDETEFTYLRASRICEVLDEARKLFDAGIENINMIRIDPAKD